MLQWKTSISNTYLSNHTLQYDLDPLREPKQHLAFLLRLNENTNKSHVAIKKILKYHPNIVMEPMFEWDAEEGEQNLKALPYVIGWFERAKEATAAAEDGEESYNIEERKLDAIFQFARAMPLLFERVSTMGVGTKKRKREHSSCAVM